MPIKKSFASCKCTFATVNTLFFSVRKLAQATVVSLLFLYACGNSEEPAVPTASAPANSDEIIRFPVSGDGVVDTADLPRISFSESLYDYGTVDEGAIVSHRFSFTNTGNSPLIITSATSTCGCTVPEYPEGPIAPGDTSSVKVVFNTDNKSGPQKKPVTLVANTYPNRTVIELVGVVDKK